MYKHVIFDFDGTLADSRLLFIRLYNELAQAKNLPQLNPSDWEKLKGLSILDRCKRLGVPLYKIPFWAGEFLKLYRQNLEQLQLYEGVREMLSNIHQAGIKSAIISSNSVENISIFLAHQGIRSIDQIISSKNLFGKDKSIKSYLKQHQLFPHEVLYVGDELRDIEACHKMNVAIAWVEWGYDPWEAVEAAKPQYRISTLSELQRLLVPGTEHPLI